MEHEQYGLFLSRKDGVFSGRWSSFWFMVSGVRLSATMSMYRVWRGQEEGEEFVDLLRIWTKRST